MSKRLKTIYHLAFLTALILQASTGLQAQTVKAKIKITDSNAFVEGEVLDAGKTNNATNLSFLKSYAGTENLGARVASVNLFDQNGQRVDYQKLADGEFLAESPFTKWNYRVDLSVPENVSARAHVSWFSGEQGILMPGDLLPEFTEKTSAVITLDVAPEWQISSVEKKIAENVFRTADVEKAVFYVGKNWREKEIAAGSAKLNLIVSGEWQTADEEAARMASEIFAFYEKLFGGKSFERAALYLGKFPADVKTGRWEAETRGASVTIFSSELSFKSQSAQRLHEQLRHEIFHLWLPNGVNLSGNYDWFYEGFALYASLKMAVGVRRIRFEDYLDTLARAHSIDSLQTQKQSLIEASKNRWNGANTQVYARGMLVAFLADVALLQKSKGKTSLADLLREIYQNHAFPAPRRAGNEVVLNAFERRSELRPISEKYIKAAETIAWQTDLESIGIESATENFSTKLRVKPDPSGRQKDLLDKLGYNSWRKTSELSK